jgi:outer membrane lipopolysaccharide assembly protein LptE/RlpB
MKSLVPLLLLISFLTLSGCDWNPRTVRPAPAAATPPAPVADLPNERSEPITWDEALSAFAFEGQAITAARL